MEESKKKEAKGLAVKIIVPILILLGVVTIWITKNYNDLSKDNEADAEQSGSEVNDTDVAENTDFELNVTQVIDLEQLKSYGVPIIIDFGADTCIPCKEMAPVLEKINKELKGKAIVRFVDVWKYPDLAKNFPISVIPTQVIIDKEGNPYVPSDDNSKGIIMYSSKDTNEHVFTAHEGGITEEALLSILDEMGMEE